MLTAQIKRVDSIYRIRKQERNVMDYDDLLLNVKRLLVEKPEIAAILRRAVSAHPRRRISGHESPAGRDHRPARRKTPKRDGRRRRRSDRSLPGAVRSSRTSTNFQNDTPRPSFTSSKQTTARRPRYLASQTFRSRITASSFPKCSTAVRRSRDFKPALVPCSDVDQQSAFVASRILELRDDGTSFEEMAVMYRSHYHSIELQLELSRRNIPYRVQSGVRFFEQAHIKDVISYLRLIVNPRDELAWKRVLKMIPGIGNKTANTIFESIAGSRLLTDGSLFPNAGDDVSDNAASKNRGDYELLRRVPEKIRNKATWQSFVELLEMLVNDENRDKPSHQIGLILEKGYEKHLEENYENADARMEDLRGLAQFASRYDSTEELLSELALLSTERFAEPTGVIGEDVIEGGDEDELLTLTSVHQAKGLEWKAVFIIWAAEGKFPSPRSLKEIDSEEEERRLWYVALTRAKDELYLTYPLLMTDYKRQAVLQKPSRFILECPPAMFEIWNLEEPVVTFEDTIDLSSQDAAELLN